MSRGGVHNALPRGSLSQALARVLGDTVGEDGLERYGETLTPTLNLWELAEWAYLRKERVCLGYVAPAPVAGQNGVLSLVNPAGSGILAVVTSLRAGITAANALVDLAWPMAEAAAIGAAVATSQSADSRYGAINRPALQLLSGTTAAPPVGPANVQEASNLAATMTELLPVPLILIPGTCVIAWDTTANQGFRCNVAWRERQALPGELD